MTSSASSPSTQSYSTDSRADLCKRLRDSISSLDGLCRELEQIADGLPESVDIGSCNSLATNLYMRVKSAHELEERHLFPMLLKSSSARENIAGIVERLRFEHWEDEAYADEVQAALQNFARAPQLTNIEGLSWMLRGFFEGLRRHNAFERDYVLPMLAA